jgi:hypothetical protein
MLAGQRRYAHITALHCNPVNPPLLSMRKVISEDAVWPAPCETVHRPSSGGRP